MDELNDACYGLMSFDDTLLQLLASNTYVLIQQTQNSFTFFPMCFCIL
jgi:hypothetical protein